MSTDDIDAKLADKSLWDQRRAFERMLIEDPVRYNRPETQAMYSRVLERSIEAGEIDPHGNETPHKPTAVRMHDIYRDPPVAKDDEP